MKKSLTAFGVFAFCLVVFSEEPFREFTDKEGRKAKLRVVNCDPGRNSVTLEQERNHQRVKVPMNAFCEKDQEYFQTWYLSHKMMSDQNLKLSFSKKIINKRKEQIMGTITYYDNGITETRTEAIGFEKREKIAYCVDIENKVKTPIENARIEYVIYYEQETPQTSGSNLKRVTGKRKLSVLEQRKPVSFRTDVVELLEIKYTSSTQSFMNAESEVFGIRVRIYVKPSDDGEEIMREVKDPSSLSDEDYPWQYETKPSLSI